MNDELDIERLKVARYEARQLGYLLMVDDAPNIEPLRYQTWAAPAVTGQATMGRFLSYGESLGDAAESGLATLKATLGEGDDAQRVKEVIAWFSGHGMELWLHEIDGGWSAPMMSYSTEIGAGAYGRGNTAREAAEDARQRYEGDVAAESVDVVVKTPPAEARAEAPPPTIVISGVGAIESSEAFGTPSSGEVDEAAAKLVEIAPDFSWRAAFIQEPSGEYRAHLIDDKGDVIKTATGDDFQDAILELFKDTYPPSEEGRTH